MKTFWSITALACLITIIAVLGNLESLSAGQDSTNKLLIILLGVGGPLAIAIFAARRASTSTSAPTTEPSVPERVATPTPLAVAEPYAFQAAPITAASVQPLKHLGYVQLINESARLEKLVRQQTRKVEGIKANAQGGAIGFFVGSIMAASLSPLGILFGALLTAAGALAYIVNALSLGNETQMLYLTEDALTDCRAQLAITQATTSPEK